MTVADVLADAFARYGESDWVFGPADGESDAEFVASYRATL